MILWISFFRWDFKGVNGIKETIIIRLSKESLQKIILQYFLRANMKKMLLSEPRFRLFLTYDILKPKPKFII